MILQNRRILMAIDGINPEGALYWIACAVATHESDGTPIVDYSAIGEKTSDPVFSADAAGNPFETRVEYWLYGEHPDRAPDGQLARMIFDDLGVLHALSPDEKGEDVLENPTGGGGSGTLPSLTLKASSQERNDSLKLLLLALDTAGYQLICDRLPCSGDGDGSGLVATVDDAGCYDPEIPDHSITNAHLQTGSVSEDKTTFLYSGKNLFNYLDERNQTGKYYDENGTLISGTDLANTFTLSHPIKVKKGATYVMNNMQIATFFNKAGNRVGTANAPRVPIYFQVPDTCAYIQVNVPNDSLEGFQIEQGTVGTGFEAYTLYGSIKTDDAIKALAAGTLGLKLGRSLAGRLTTGKNLYDQEDDSNLYNWYITDKGELISDITYTVTHPIKVTGGQWYTPNFKGFGVFFSAEGIRLGGLNFSRQDNKFQAPAGAAFVLLSIPKNWQATFQLEPGQNGTGYESFKATLNVETPTGTAALAKAGLAFRFGQSILNRFSAGGKNLYDVSDPSNLDGVYIDNLGEPHDDDANSISHFIPVSGSAWYTPNFKGFVAFYNQYGNWVGGAVFNRADNKFFTTPDTRYLLITIPIDRKAGFQLEPGQNGTGYELYKPVVKATTAQGDNNALAIAATTTRVVTIENFYKTLSNLFNKNFPTTDPNDRNVDNTYVDNDGNFNSLNGYLVSHFIPVKPNTYYSASPSREFIAFYHAGKLPVDGGVALGRTTNYFQTGPNTYFIRMTVPMSSKAIWMVVEGKVALSYSPYQSTIPLTIPKNTYAGKSILLLGTSIPANVDFIDKIGPHELANMRLNVGLINNAVPGSQARISRRDGTYTDFAYEGRMLCLSHTLAEKEQLITNYEQQVYPNLNPNFYRPSSLSSDMKAYIRSTSYEVRIKPYLDGTYAKPDWIFFEHGPNDKATPGDQDSDWTVMPDPSTYGDRSTFPKAMGYLISYIYSLQPRQKIAIISHSENQMRPLIVQGQQLIADRFCLPILRLDKMLGWTQDLVPGSNVTRYQQANPDGIHPHSDPTLVSRDDLANLIQNFNISIL